MSGRVFTSDILWKIIYIYRKRLRSILKNIFKNHSFSIPEFDLSIGLGGDIESILNYYTIGDPLNLLAVFVPACHTEILFNVLIVARLYLAGIAFFLYCRYHSYESSRILPGAVMIASPVFLPSVTAVLGSSRVGGTFSIPRLYELIYYIKLPIAFMNAS